MDPAGHQVLCSIKNLSSQFTLKIDGHVALWMMAITFLWQNQPSIRSFLNFGRSKSI